VKRSLFRKSTLAFAVAAVLTALPSSIVRTPLSSINANALDPAPLKGTSEAHFIALMHKHIRNVKIIGVAALHELKQRYPGEYTSISDDEVSAFLELHDQAKVNRTEQFLAEHHIPKNERFGKLLSKYYGATPETLKSIPGKSAPTEWDELRHIVDHLNETDTAVVNSYLKKFPTEKQQSLRFIEKLADCLDTSLNRKQEFSSKNFAPASVFFKQQLKSKPMPELGHHAKRLPEIARYFEGQGPGGIPRLTLILHKNLPNRVQCLARLLHLLDSRARK